MEKKRKGRLFYLPIEAYDSRYTEYLSVPGGVFETQAMSLVKGHTCRGPARTNQVGVGFVLNPLARASWAFSQTTVLLEHVVRKDLDPANDVIYIEDFWHPGFEMIPYTQSLVYGCRKHNHVPVYSFSHAQTPDPYDFTHPMRSWMRPMEKGWMQYQSGVFCAAREMLQQFREAKLPTGHMYATGQVFHGETIHRIVGTTPPEPGKIRKSRVIWSSRWDTEKNPWLFLQLMYRVLRHRKDISFAVCTGSKELKSNCPRWLGDLWMLTAKYPDRVVVHEGLSKKQYFEILQDSRVQFNSASQDFVSYTLTEAALNGCAPLYPWYLTFPDALAHRSKNLYAPGDMDDAERKLYDIIDAEPEDYSWVYKPYEHSVHRMLHRMGFDVPEPVPLKKMLSDNRMLHGDLK